MQAHILLAGVTTIALFGACAGTRGAEGLLGKEWVLQSYGVIGSEKTVAPSTQITLGFSSDNTIHGSAGCNRYFSAYEAGKNNTLSIQNIGATKMWCGRPVMDQEKRYFEALENTSTFTIEGHRLQLFSDNGQRVLTFIKKE
ncbi:MAG: META domain-containing protein [Candidatus Methylomirabilales bacterium]